MARISPAVTAFVLAAVLTLGLNQAGAAQAPDPGGIQQQSVTVFRAKAPVTAPAAKTETEGNAPSADAVRIPGYWDFQGNQATAANGGWVWIPGRYTVPPVPGARWHRAHWGFRDEWWTWIPGHFEVKRD